jgi:hypothetical protein
MKMKKNRILIFVFFVLCAACASEFQAQSQSSLFVTATKNPTLTSSPGPVSPSPFPTLLDQLQKELYDGMTSSKCELPCFLGVVPGKTSLRDSISIFEIYAYNHKMSRDTADSYAPYQWFRSQFYTNKDDRHITFHLYLQSLEDITSGLKVSFGPILKPDRNADSNSKLLEVYGIVQLFQKHGIPDEIFLYPTRVRQTQSAYGIEIVYHDEKILANYGGAAKLAENDKYELCPNIGDGDVQDFTIAVGNPLDDLNVIELTWGSFNPNFDLSSYGDDLQRLDPQGLYSLFMEKREKCFYEDQYWLQ